MKPTATLTTATPVTAASDSGTDLELDDEVVVESVRSGDRAAGPIGSGARGMEGEAAAAERNYLALVDRLNKQSVEKNFDPYIDIAWDAPEMALDPADARWADAADGWFGDTDWYRSLSLTEQSRLGLFRVATAMKLGLEFENILKRGLLDYAFRLPNGSPEFRYLYHETIEEAHHALMFQEFVNRSGMAVSGLSSLDKTGSRAVVALARWFPSLFFLFVLGGEDPIDYQQRKILREGAPHPLLERIMRIHVTEEARHLSFARHHLKREVPKLSWARRTALSVAAPILLSQMARQMLLPPRAVVKEFAVPKEVVTELVTSPAAIDAVCDSLGKVRKLCIELGLVNRFTVRLWKSGNIWAESA